MCQLCDQIHSLVKKFNSNVGLARNYKLHGEAIADLSKLYDEGVIELYAGDFHFKDTIEVLHNETSYTVQQYFFCKKCKQFFAIGACIRGTPYFKVINDIKKKKYNATFNRGISGKIGIYYKNPKFLRSGYAYIFDGTKEELIELIENMEYEFSKKEKAGYHLFSHNESNILLGIGRTGHSGGYFFNASLEKIYSQIIINGDIKVEKPYMSKMTKSEKLFFTILDIVLFLPRIIFITLFKVIGLEETKIKRKKKLNKFFIEYIGCEKNY